jgi:viroplasmin and RNaseH domain-containing protein
MGRSGVGTATPQVSQAAQQFVRKLSQLLSVWVQKYPPLDRQHTVEVMMSKGAARAVYMTLDNRGLGIWSDTWDRFYPNTEKLEGFLRRTLTREFETLQTAIQNAAIQTTGG